MEKIITMDNFEKEVLKSEIPVMIDFYADWCGPCKMMAPLVEELAEEYQDKVKICKCNTEENMELVQKYKIMSIPTFMFFKNGEKTDLMRGVTSREEMKKKLDSLI